MQGMQRQRLRERSVAHEAQTAGLPPALSPAGTSLTLSMLSASDAVSERIDYDGQTYHTTCFKVGKRTADAV